MKFMTRLIGASLIFILLFVPAAFSAERININTAGEKELKALPGIGSVIAKRIIEYREAKKGFKTIEELMNVKGIGKKKFEQLKDKVTAGEEKK